MYPGRVASPSCFSKRFDCGPEGTESEPVARNSIIERIEIISPIANPQITYGPISMFRDLVGLRLLLHFILFSFCNPTAQDVQMFRHSYGVIIGSAHAVVGWCGLSFTAKNAFATIQILERVDNRIKPG